MEQGAILTARRYSREARQHLGRQLSERRVELDPRFHDRRIFAAERGIGYKLSQDLENVPPKRGDSAPVTLRDKVAPAYGVTYESIQDLLDEVPGAELAAAPGQPPRRARGRHRAASRAAAADGLVDLLSPDREDRARTYHDQIAENRDRWRIAYAAAHPGIAVDDVPEPPGTDLFPGSALYAAEWDENADVLTVAQRIWLVAELQVFRAAARERQSGTG